MNKMPLVHKTGCTSGNHKGLCRNNMRDRLGFPRRTTPAQLLEALKDILNSVETEGCDGDAATVSVKAINKGRGLVGWELLEEEYEEEDEDEDDDDDDDEWDEDEEDEDEGGSMLGNSYPDDGF